MSNDPRDTGDSRQPTFLQEIFGQALGYLLVMAIVGFTTFLEWIRSIPQQQPGNEYLAILVTAVSISAAFWYFVLRFYDRYTPVPARFYVFLILAGGVMSTMPAGIFNTMFAEQMVNMYGTGEACDIRLYLFVGPNEEFLKLTATVLLTWHSREIREPLDVIVAAGAVGLGFATFENIGYMINHGNQVIVDRTLTSVPMHLLLSAIWGYGLAYVRFHPSFWKKTITRLLPLFILSAAVHDFYNIVVVYLGTLLQLAIVWISFIVAFGFSLRGALYSDATQCNKCHSTLPHNTTHCPQCHEPVRNTILPACPRCSSMHLWTARYCHNCGHDLEAWKSLKHSTTRRLLARRKRSFRTHKKV